MKKQFDCQINPDLTKRKKFFEQFKITWILNFFGNLPRINIDYFRKFQEPI
jgi:hypothetical protein